jgi:DDE superfamily endonuclease
MRKSRISAVICTFMDAFFKLALPYLSNPRLFQHRFDFYSKLIGNKAGLPNLPVWGFIDGTLRRTCRPTYFQQVAYSGHKRCHGIKFQSVVVPDGLIALLYGPIEGRRHDCFMLSESGLLQELRNTMPEGSPIFALYGDAAYPQSAYLFGGFPNAQPGSNEAQWNTKMSKVREAVEWLFKEVATQWAFLDVKNRMKIFKFPVAKYYIVAAFLTNLRTCCYGSQTGIYFGCPEPGAEPNGERLTLAEYLALVA